MTAAIRANLPGVRVVSNTTVGRATAPAVTLHTHAGDTLTIEGRPDLIARIGVHLIRHAHLLAGVPREQADSLADALTKMTEVFDLEGAE